MITVGETIASKRYMGTVVSAFFNGEEWCYGIGENAHIEDGPQKGDDGYRMGPKYIRESEIHWRYYGGAWAAVK